MNRDILKESNKIIEKKILTTKDYFGKIVIELDVTNSTIAKKITINNRTFLVG